MPTTPQWIDHSVHDIRPGDLVTISRALHPQSPWPGRWYRVKRLVKRSRNPRPCAVVEPWEGPRYECTYWVGWLNKIETTTIPTDKWDEFMEWLDKPSDPEVVESLRRLFATPTVLERSLHDKLNLTWPEDVPRPD